MCSGDGLPHPSEAGGPGGAGCDAEQMPDVAKYMAVRDAEREWRRLNGDLWRAEVEAWALNEAEHGRRFSVASAIQRIRWKDRVDAEGNAVQVNDHYAPIWSRVLVKLHPWLEPFVVTRRTPWDYVPELEVEP